jgi:alanine-synthesizing transaminase
MYMRTNIIHAGADELTYEIREIVEVGKRFESMGVEMYWENIGDPIAKGQTVLPWIKDIVSDTTAHNDASYGYCPTRGIDSTRAYIAEKRNSEGGVQITADDILFFNGLGDAIATTYTYLNRNARILGPNPAYSTHSSAEAAHAGSPHLTYDLNPHRNWLPDLEDIRNKVKYNPSIAGILIINPDNPTGMVYPEQILRGIVEIAREYDLFIISDEIYSNIVYGEQKMIPLSQVLGDVPGVAMKGLSKEIPWPGARCGWIEFYNKDSDTVFARYAKTLVDAKMLEVCATTLPQTVLPMIFEHEQYAQHLIELSDEYRKKADIAYDILRKVPGITAPKPSGAFYMSVVFDDNVLKDGQTLPVEQKEVQEMVNTLTHNVPHDKRFVYYLMASTGICVVPLSGMNSHLDGFRMTLLEPDMDRFEHMVQLLARHIKTYITS